MFLPGNEVKVEMLLSTVDKADTSLTLSQLLAPHSYWLYLLLSLFIGLLVGIRITAYLWTRGQARLSDTDTLVVGSSQETNSHHTAKSINAVIRNLINSQFMMKEQGGSVSSLQTPLRESIKQLRLIVSHLQRSDLVNNSLNDIASHKMLASCKLRELVDEQFCLAQSYLNDCALSLDYEIDSELFVALPADWLGKAIREVIVNAVKHNKHKLGLRINLRVSMTKTHILIDICDNGQGIPNELTQALNNPSDDLYALQSVVNPTLLPIDLSAIQIYLLQQKGELSISSARHFVTKVCLKLPIFSADICDTHTQKPLSLETQKTKTTDLQIPQHQFSIDDTRQKHHFPNLLIVNLDQTPISYARTNLYQHFSIFDARALPEAIEILNHQKIDCVVVDVGVTGTYTIDTLKFLRKHEKCNDIPCVIIGAEIDKTSQLQMLNLGLFALLVHPIQGQQVCNILKSLLQQKQNLHDSIHEDLANYHSPHNDITTYIEDNSFVAKFQKVLKLHYADEDFNRQIAAQHMLLHERTLHRRLSEHYDLSFTEILKQYRLQIAKKMIENGDNVTTTAYETGFSSPSYFAQCFKSEYGIQPSSLNKQA